MSHKIVFERFEKNNAYFKSEDNKTIILPSNFTSKDIKAGDTVFLKISEKETLAKDILNELLNTEE